MSVDKNKILIVDDDGFLLDMYSFKFSQDNFEVFTAINGALALEKLHEGLKPDVILMDIMMPEMNGFETLEKINQESLSKDSVKIILSNNNQKSEIEKGHALGIDGYIVKANSTPAEVIERVNEILLNKKIHSKENEL
jgi:CheY-like chemotaxis protein